MINKKWYPWIPVVGWLMTILSDPRETGLNNIGVSIGSAIYQAAILVAIMGVLL